MKHYTVCIETHGCKLNMADSQVLAREFSSRGHLVKSDTIDGTFDVYILNSCTVTHVADKKARQKLRQIRKANPHCLVTIAGCYATLEKDKIEKFNFVDLVLPNTKKQQIVDIVDSVIEKRNPLSLKNRSFMETNSYFELNLSRTRSAVKIQEGCNQICSYCIIPKVRGREKSVPKEEIIERICSLVDSGVKEVILTGTQLGTYGYDLPKGNTLESLIETIICKTKVQRVRVSSLQPLEITTELINLYKYDQDNRLCKHFHIALQSGSNRILKMMRRRYTQSQYLQVIETIRTKLNDNCSITTDIICGFPTETEVDHEATKKVVEIANFGDTHIFPFSDRPGTTAFFIKNKILNSVKKRRVTELITLSSKKRLENLKSYLNKPERVLIEKILNGEAIGYSEYYNKVKIKIPSCLNSHTLLNKLVEVKIVELHGSQYLVGELAAQDDGSVNTTTNSNNLC